MGGLICPRRCAATSSSSPSTPHIDKIISMVYHDLSSASTLPKVHFQPGGHLTNVSKLFHYTKTAGFPFMVKKPSSLPTLYLACQFQIYSACLYSIYHRVFSKITAQNSCNGPKNSARIVPSNCTGK